MQHYIIHVKSTVLLEINFAVHVSKTRSITLTLLINYCSILRNKDTVKVGVQIVFKTFQRDGFFFCLFIVFFVLRSSTFFPSNRYGNCVSYLMHTNILFHTQKRIYLRLIITIIKNNWKLFDHCPNEELWVLVIFYDFFTYAIKLCCFHFFVYSEWINHKISNLNILLI